MKKGKYTNKILLSFTFLFLFFSLNFVSAWNFETDEVSVRTTTLTGNLTLLSQLEDTNIPAPANTEVLSYDTGTGKWIAVAASAVGDTNETSRFNNLTSTDCSGTDKVTGVANNGTIICGADTGGSGGNTTDEIFGAVNNGTFERIGHNYYNSTTWDTSWNASAGSDGVGQNATFIGANYSFNINKSNIGDYNYYNGTTWNPIWNASSGTDGVGQNATFVGANYSFNINKSNIADYNYYNGSTWNNIWNATTSDGVGQNATFVGANYSQNVNKSNIGVYNYYNGSTWNTIWNTSSADGVGQNATFIGINYTGNINRSNIGTFNYFNSSTWNNIWNASTDTNVTSFVTNLTAINCSGTDKMTGVYRNGTPVCSADAGGSGGNTTQEVWDVINNGTFDRYKGYYNSSLINSTQMEEQGSSLGIKWSWLTTFWDTIWGTKTTDDLTEGTTNLYDNSTWNETRANTLYIEEGTQLGNTTNEIFGAIDNGTFERIGNGYYNGTTWDTSWNSSSADGVGQNATFVGANYTTNINRTNVNASIDARTISTTYYPTLNFTLYGTDSGGNNIGNLSFIDDQTFNITEDNGANALEFYVNFTGVSTTPDFITMGHQYTGTHTMYLSVWDYDSSTWEVYETISQQPSIIKENIALIDGSNHVSGEVVRIKFTHPDNGVASNKLIIDFINLVDGFSSVTTTEHDGLSGRDNIENHPWVLPTNGTLRNASSVIVTNNVTANWFEGRINYSDVQNHPTDSDSIGQNATFIGANYSQNVNGSNIGSYNYYNGSTWDTSWNSSSGNTTQEVWDVIDNGTFDRYKGYYNSSLVNSTQFEEQGSSLGIVWTWFSSTFDTLFGTKTTDDLTEGSTNLYDNSTWNETRANTLYIATGTALGNSTDEIFGAVDNGTFDRAGHGYYNSTTWDTSWNTTSYNTTNEIFGAIDNNTFLKSEVNWDANYSRNVTCYSTPDCLSNTTWNGTHRLDF